MSMVHTVFSCVSLCWTSRHVAGDHKVIPCEPSSFTKPGHKEGVSLQKIAKPLRDVFVEAMSNLITWCQQSEAVTERPDLPDSLIARFLHCNPSTCFVLLKCEITWMVFLVWFVEMS